ncbi:MAG TPA: hypothetical protein VH189_03860 [Rhizomicrobium sp.]|jgi:hypothetical protein|nr:hypothetical protein [Rhizomicrobium sp.]
MHGFKSVVAAVTVAAMVGSSAFAADRALVPGKPAGVKSAQEISKGTLLIGLGAAAIITAVAVVVSNQSGSHSAPNTFAGPATSTTPP